MQATFESKGLPAISALAYANARDLLPIIRWNERHGIKFFRLSSGAPSTEPSLKDVIMLVLEASIEAAIEPCIETSARPRIEPFIALAEEQYNLLWFSTCKCSFP
jgi:UV DNA damage repair endonuclease